MSNELKSFILVVSYQGQYFYGFHKQKHVKTVHGQLDKLINEFGVNKFRIIPASRTDRGVHCLKQYVQLNTKEDLDLTELRNYLIKCSNEQLKIHDVIASQKSFSVISEPKVKTYRYYFTLTTPLLKKYEDKILYFENDLDISLMSKAAEYLIGTHDFRHFSYKVSEHAMTKRKIISSQIHKGEGDYEHFPHSGFQDPYFCFEIQADGFLRYMVRLIMGSLLNIGQKKYQLEDLQNNLQSKGTRTSFVAPASGLYLSDIVYKRSFTDTNN